jgi:hypothetical protein
MAFEVSRCNGHKVGDAAEGGRRGAKSPGVGSLRKKRMQGRVGGSLESVFHGHGASFVGFGI